MLLRFLRGLLGSRAPEELVVLGQRAFESADYAAAADHLSKALAGLPPTDARRTLLELQYAIALQECRRPADAERVLKEVLAREPDCPGALMQLAMLRFIDSDAGEARRLMDRYVARHDDAASRLRRALMTPIILESGEQIDEVRRRLEADLDRLIAERLQPMRHPEGEVLLTPFYLAYHGRNNRNLLRKLCRTCRAHYPARTQIGRKLGARGKRLRIGFVSSFFHLHSVGRTTYGLIRDLPRTDFEVHVFAISPRTDALALAIRAAADTYVGVPGDVDQARAAIEAAELDILLFADIGMHPVTTYLSLWRLAPLQLTTWGHSITSGIDTIDYYVSADAIETPDAQELYSEKLMRLPGYFLPRYERPAPGRARKSRAALAWPADRHVYFCPQSLFKLHPDFDRALKGIAERDAKAEIVLLGAKPAWQERLTTRLEKTLGDAADRVRFAPPASHADFLDYLAAADVVIDSFHFGGCNTSAEALSLGVPIVTLPAFQLPGRFTLGLYRELGIDSCIAADEAGFVDLAVRVASEPDFRRTVSAQISERAGALFDRPDTGRVLGEELLRLVSSAR